MSAASKLLRRAGERAEGLRTAYRSSGVWSADPLDVVRNAALRDPAAPAVVDRSGVLSYADLDQRVDDACAVLEAHGVEASTVALIVVGNDVESVVAVHAALRMDAVPLLVPRSAGPVQIADIAARAGADIGVAPRWMITDHAELSSQLRAWIAIEAIGPRAVQARSRQAVPRRGADEPSVVLYTSGTTSKPKGVIHSVSTLVKSASNYIAAAGLQGDDRLLLISPLASVTGVLQALFVAPMLTAPVILEDRWNPLTTYELLISSGATWYGGPDRLLDRLLDLAVATKSAPGLRAVYLGGTMLDRRVIGRIEDDFGIIVMRAYGSSEVPVSTSGRRAEPRDVRHADDGTPLDDVEVRIGSLANPTECCIRGPHMFLGYTDRDETALEDGWYRTGDVAEIDGDRVRIVGRLRDIVIRNGLKIPIAEVEEAICGIAGVRECAAYSVTDPTTSERLVAAVVVEPGVHLTLSDLAEQLIATGLPKYKLPEELVFWDEPLPENANGKVDRATLRAGSPGRPRDVATRLSQIR